MPLERSELCPRREPGLGVGISHGTGCASTHLLQSLPPPTQPLPSLLCHEIPRQEPGNSSQATEGQQPPLLLSPPRPPPEQQLLEFVFGSLAQIMRIWGQGGHPPVLPCSQCHQCPAWSPQRTETPECAWEGSTTIHGIGESCPKTTRDIEEAKGRRCLESWEGKRPKGASVPT